MAQLSLIDEAATVECGNQLAQAVKNKVKQGITVYLNGDLGAGKTTFTRGFVKGMGHKGNVKSPTYTLVEPYELEGWHVYHFDLYRLADPEELEFMGIRDYFNSQSCCFIEWPEKGYGLLAKPDLTINIAYDNEQRCVSFEVNSTLGEQALSALMEYYRS
ncbi:tRNA (adenosine(37)-N6)-threonylcarbamoyltransferase complex ATPase subunit type 1 TsaE [Thalassotalea atypica]|uniref:tRNA (adenosine(37)-N6)-threonylcarbamoyltransferase complex ATPase subunit type 1 TsaE n=1 Tax=Thalassotalea atypica TaxID=2054316 RepID=UPI0025736D94|nr:tRNA (adenosine(37)-N6)-threonylcarbamoyltransferase complex ATPase subunit type 1 TsaE [Thalassotalea atypica]